jgi:hypothetical protein
MPYKFDTEKKKIERRFDRRIKLTDIERDEIKKLYGRFSQRELARRFNVSRRLVIFIGCPEKYEHSKELYKERRKDGRYYKKSRHTKAVKRLREHKKILFGLSRNPKIKDNGAVDTKSLPHNSPQLDLNKDSRIGV